MDWFLDWLWQGSALALIVACLLRVVPYTSASTRYLVWWATLVGVLILPWAGRAGQVVGNVDPHAVARLQDVPPMLLPLTFPAVPAWLGVLSIGVWICVAVLRLVAVTRAIGQLRWMKRRCAEVPAIRQVRLPLWLSVRDHGRRARLCVSDDVVVGSVLGLRGPIIALPPSLLGALTDEELDQVVLHEYAHVQRRDDWAKLGQVVVESIYGLHPAVWWIGRALHIEGEIACDDWVVNRSPVPRAYASCLAKVASVSHWRAETTLAPGAMRSRREISRRVEQVLDDKRNARLRPSRVAFALGVGMIIAVVVQFGLLPPMVTLRGSSVTPDAGYKRLAQVVEVANAPRAELVAADNGAARAQIGRSSRPSAEAARRRAREVVPALISQVVLEASPAPMVGTQAVRLQPSGRGFPFQGRSKERATLASSPWPDQVGRLRGSAELGRDGMLARALSDRQPGSGRPTVDAEEDPNADGGRAAWSKLAGAGVSVGSDLTKAGVATAGAFRDLGVSVARAFSRRH